MSENGQVRKCRARGVIADAFALGRGARRFQRPEERVLFGGMTASPL
jgi:hypothetical protein